MVRRVEQTSVESTSPVNATMEPPSNRSQKKHKKHKKRKDEIDIEDIGSDTSIDVSFEDDIDKPAFKVKLKMGRDAAASTSAADLLKIQALESKRGTPSSNAGGTPPKPSVKKKKGKGRDSGTSSEEERWLDAIESGNLEEVDDELKKIKPKDPKMMTARQRAMYERGNEKGPAGDLLALPSGYKEKVMTEEAIQKAAIKSQKRKQLADEKREKDKKKTMERLLKKQESKSLKNNQRIKPFKKKEPMIIYKNSKDEITLTFPIECVFPLVKKEAIDPPKPVLCGVVNCENIKKYNCSKTGVPLCSLECYKKNMSVLN